jgi:hypothetical protein
MRTPAYPKRPTEADPPGKQITAYARREKSIRHGPVSMLRIWRACRAQAGPDRDAEAQLGPTAAALAMPPCRYSWSSLPSASCWPLRGPSGSFQLTGARGFPRQGLPRSRFAPQARRARPTSGSRRGALPISTGWLPYEYPSGPNPRNRRISRVPGVFLDIPGLVTGQLAVEVAVLDDRRRREIQSLGAFDGQARAVLGRRDGALVRVSATAVLHHPLGRGEDLLAGGAHFRA